MIFCNQGRCEFMGTGMDLSADLSIIIEHYFSVFEKEYDEKTTKGTVRICAEDRNGFEKDEGGKKWQD